MDYARIERNVRKMVDQGAPESDIDAYLSEEGLTPEQFRDRPKGNQAAAAAPLQREDIDTLLPALPGESDTHVSAPAEARPLTMSEGIRQQIVGGGLGFGDEYNALISAITDRDRAPTFGERYRSAQQHFEQQGREFAEAHPGEAMLTDVTVGSIPALRGAKTLQTGMQAVSRTGQALKNTLLSANIGALAGYGNASAGEALQGAGEGALWGGAFGVGMSAGQSVGSKLGNKFANSQLGQRFAGSLQRMRQYVGDLLDDGAPVPAQSAQPAQGATAVAAPAMGAPAASAPATPAARPEMTIDNAAADRMLQAMQRDQDTPAALLDRLRQRQQIGKPGSIAEVGGQNVQDLGRATFTAPGAGKQIARTQLDNQARGMVGRVLNDLEQGMGARAVDSDQLIDDIGRAKSGRANVEYTAARNLPPRGSEQLVQQLESTPIYRQVWEGVVGPLRQAGGYNLPPLFNAEGRLLRSPTVEDIDLIKRGLDGRIYTGRGRAIDEAASDKKPALGAMEDRRRELLQIVDPLYPEYAQARLHMANDTERQEAIELGQALIERNELGREIARRLGELTPAQRQLAQQGALDALERKLLSAADNAEFANVVKSIYGFGNGLRGQQLRALFGEAYDLFEQRAQAEINRLRLRNHVMGGSQTANKIAELQDTDDALQVAGSAVIDAGKGDFGTAMARGARYVMSQTIDRARAGVNESTRAEIANRLFRNDNADQAEDFLRALEKMRLDREEQMTRRAHRGTIIGVSGGAAAGRQAGD